MANYNDSKYHFRANQVESNEKAVSQLILKDFFLIPLNWCSLRRQFKGICSN